ncbi:hypothetical protein ELZ19_06705 [Brucella abortus]|uniref:capsid cement protein n=1 Tax=Brucella abortus TaxID=235 RepID=UPI0004E8B335|nr:capsid cement protein [Brucella abortus]KFH18430.1 hypothetical protein IB60_17125 [Brucella abortus LMN1]RUQ67340.1 hypothetical protein ELZ23_15540 [Brucella abortus]RUQ78156.1 hypothetical protein ELZ22_17335 [Brucella abortus]RUQ88273.1 hypothetical protein ELZ18_15540 [Brucella abortus]RUQ90302.1 hypothetical protein ELZ20_15535 [Brucella abortus]
MATSESTRAVNMIAGEDLRGDLFEILQIENDGGVGKVIKATGVTNTVIGVLAEEPRKDVSTDGETVPVILLHGVVPMKAGDSITAGQLIVPDATAGRVAGVANVGALAADSMAIGVALESASDGDIFRVLAMPIAAPHSA